MARCLLPNCSRIFHLKFSINLPLCVYLLDLFVCRILWDVSYGKKYITFNRAIPIWHRIVKLIIDNTLDQNVTICVIFME